MKTDENGIEVWNTRFTDFGDGSINSVRQLPDGGYILTGLRTSTAGGLLFIKTDELGNEQWNTIYGMGMQATGNSVQQTSDGGHIIAGHIIATADKDVWLIKLASTAVGTEEELDILPEKYALSQNYPNPFNPETVIKYSIPKAENVSLVVYNLIGEKVAILINERKPAGSFTVDWDASNMASGIYYYRLQAGDFVQTRKMVLLK